MFKFESCLIQNVLSGPFSPRPCRGSRSLSSLRGFLWRSRLVQCSSMLEVTFRVVLNVENRYSGDATLFVVVLIRLVHVIMQTWFILIAFKWVFLFCKTRKRIADWECLRRPLPLQCAVASVLCSCFLLILPSSSSMFTIRWRKGAIVNILLTCCESETRVIIDFRFGYISPSTSNYTYVKLLAGPMIAFYRCNDSHFRTICMKIPLLGLPRWSVGKNFSLSDGLKQQNEGRAEKKASVLSLICRSAFSSWHPHSPLPSLSQSIPFIRQVAESVHKPSLSPSSSFIASFSLFFFRFARFHFS